MKKKKKERDRDRESKKAELKISNFALLLMTSRQRKG